MHLTSPEWNGFFSFSSSFSSFSSSSTTSFSSPRRRPGRRSPPGEVLRGGETGEGRRGGGGARAAPLKQRRSPARLAQLRRGGPSGSGRACVRLFMFRSGPLPRLPAASTAPKSAASRTPRPCPGLAVCTVSALPGLPHPAAPGVGGSPGLLGQLPSSRCVGGPKSKKAPRCSGLRWPSGRGGWLGSARRGRLGASPPRAGAATRRGLES